MLALYGLAGYFLRPWWRWKGQGRGGVDRVGVMMASAVQVRGDVDEVNQFRNLILISDDEVRDEVWGYRRQILGHGDANH